MAIFLDLGFSSLATWVLDGHHEEGFKGGWDRAACHHPIGCRFALSEAASIMVVACSDIHSDDNTTVFVIDVIKQRFLLLC